MATTSASSPLLLLLAVFVLAVASAALPDITPLLSKSNPWAAFQNLSGCHFGDEKQGLARLKDYLSHFGYLPTSPSKFSDVFDADMEQAIRTYQSNFGLEVTGQLDASTLAKMMAPRCGVADVINGTSTMGKGSSSSVRGRSLYSYFPGQPSWPRSKKSLTYAVTATSATTIDRATLSAVFARAFARWSEATLLNFTETASASDADITIGFYAGSHGDGEGFDGPLGTLAHAFSPTDGRFHLDAAEAWVAGGDVALASSDAAVDLESVAVHEIGHLLGLGHTSVEGAIMYPTITSRTRKVDLASDDVVGIQSLYGSNPDFKGVTPAPPATSSREMDSAAGPSAFSRLSTAVGGGAVAVWLAIALGSW